MTRTYAFSGLAAGALLHSYGYIGETTKEGIEPEGSSGPLGSVTDHQSDRRRMAQVATSALPAEMVQTIHFLHGPKIFGGSGLSGIEDVGGSRLEETIKLIEVRLKVLSGDLGVAAYFDPSESSSSISGSRL